ncbi:histidine kinase [Aureimonas sp. Leaf454]|uniref:oxygenase MpaB family protein n=1 Tax=Aureimonas sp. Leaf454 TaxID=1736381 RepID=UPI0006F8A82A|nr:oxygenase MpaB family protein [Aureimonas sp. Leaf454]KQT53659.1 histidine kinase [Aureimonas sp. Leaf454]
MTGFGSGTVDLDTPKGDPGLFGPRSATWRVHGDFNSMMIGGIASLLMQMLHPGALAGVWDHSNFRADMGGRLRRTAQFISGTTFASTEQAEGLITRVRRIHDQVQGELPDGTPYSANDPELLCWVHVAEVSCFLDAHLRYRNPYLSASDQDRYFAEMAMVAVKLGATDVPISKREVAAYLQAMRPKLKADDRTREVVRTLLSEPAPNALLVPFREATMHAAIDLLPDWAKRMHELDISAPRRSLARVGALGIGAAIRWSLTDGSAERAKRRVSA